jgi:hypothetical protein
MRKAARVAIGHEIPVESKVVHHPHRYSDTRGTAMFETIVQLLEEIEREATSLVRGDMHRVTPDIHNRNTYSISLNTLNIPDTPDTHDTPARSTLPFELARD